MIGISCRAATSVEVGLCPSLEGTPVQVVGICIVSQDGWCLLADGAGYSSHVGGGWQSKKHKLRSPLAVRMVLDGADGGMVGIRGARESGRF